MPEEPELFEFPELPGTQPEVPPQLQPPKKNWLWITGGIVMTYAANITIQKWGAQWPDTVVWSLYVVALILFCVGAWRFEKFRKAGGKIWLILRDHPVSLAIISLILAIAVFNAVKILAGRNPHADLQRAGNNSESLPLKDGGKALPPPQVIPQPAPAPAKPKSRPSVQPGKPEAPSRPTPETNPKEQVTPVPVTPSPTGDTNQSGVGNQQTVVAGPVTQQNSGGCNQQVVGGNNNTNVCATPQRHVSADQKSKLSSLKMITGSLPVYCYASDHEGCAYAEEIRNILKDAGLDEGVTVGQIFAVPTNSEVYLAVRDKRHVPSNFQDIFNILHDAGFKPTGLTTNEVSEGELQIHIGRRK